MRTVSREELAQLCREITRSFVHLETRDTYGTDTEQPHWRKWRNGESDDYAWLTWWLDMLREHRAAGRRCRRLRIVSEPLSDYQRWVLSFTHLFVDAGEETRYLLRARLTTVALPGSGDYYVFDDTTALFLHYAGDGTNTSFELVEDGDVVRFCADAFETVWNLATPFSEYRPS